MVPRAPILRGRYFVAAIFDDALRLIFLQMIAYLAPFKGCFMGGIRPTWLSPSRVSLVSAHGIKLRDVFPINR